MGSKGTGSKIEGTESGIESYERQNSRYGKQYWRVREAGLETARASLNKNCFLGQAMSADLFVK